MDKRIKARWVKALRSGKYKQTQNALCNRDDDTGASTFCCLGVLCDIVKDRIKGSWDTDGSFSTKDGEFDTALLPQAVQDVAGLADLDPTVKERKPLKRTSAHLRAKPLDSLAKLNDAGYSFKRIATIIEREL